MTSANGGQISLIFLQPCRLSQFGISNGSYGGKILLPFGIYDTTLGKHERILTLLSQQGRKGQGVPSQRGVVVVVVVLNKPFKV